VGKNPRAARENEFIRKIKAQKAAARGEDIEDESDEDGGFRLTLEEQLYWDAFHELTTQRLHGDNGPQALAIADIAAYGYVKNFDVIDMDLYVDLMVQLDREFLKIMEEARIEAAKKNKTKNKRGRGG
jgi:hypothetical protein